MQSFKACITAISIIPAGTIITIGSFILARVNGQYIVRLT